jgi:hypothetical protein
MAHTIPQNYLELAKRGDPQAIAALINRSLQPKGITAIAQRDGNTLHLVLESPRVLAQVGVISLLQQGLSNLGIESIHTVKISARQMGKSDFLWQQNIALNPITEPPQAASWSEGSTTTHIEAHIQGNVQGQQIAIGSKIIQITNYGGKVDLTSNKPPALVARPKPEASLYCRPVNLLGRQREVAQVTQALQLASPVEVYGEVGLGKTALLRSLAYHTSFADLFTDGLVYRRIRCQPVTDVVQALFDDFWHYEGNVAVKPTDTEIRYALRGKQAVVLLDDVEWAREDIEELANYLPSLTFLLASPSRQLWEDAQAIALSGLPLEDAIALLEREVRRSLSTEERSAAESVCQLVQGHPLRLLQAAALVREQNCPLASLATLLQTVSMEEVNLRFAAQLPDAERRSLAVLSVLNGTPVQAPHLAALIALPNITPVLQNLVRQSLVMTDGSRYVLAENLLQPLQQAWDLSQWLHRILDYFITWASEQSPDIVLQSVDLLLNLAQQAIATGQWSTVLQLGQTLDPILMLSRQWGAWEQILHGSLQAAQTLSNPSATAWAMHQLGTHALVLENHALAQTHLTQALQIRESLAEEAAAALTRHNLSLLTPFVQPDRSAEPIQPAKPEFHLPPNFWRNVLVIGSIVGGGSLIAALLLWWHSSLPTRSPDIQILVSHERLDFSAQNINTRSTPQTVELRNIGTSPFDIEQLTLTGNSTSDFQVQDDCTAVPLLPQDDCTITVSFTPQEAGDRQAALTLDSADGSSQSIVTLTGQGRTVAGEVTLEFDPGAIEFPEQNLGSRSAARSITVKNTSTQPVQIKAISPLGEHKDDFWSEDNCAETTLAPGETCAVQVAFQPTREGNRVANLVLSAIGVNASADSSERVWNIALSGRGKTPPPQPTPAIRVERDRLAWGELNVGTRSEVATISLINPGSVPLILGDITLTGDQPGDFGITDNTCGNRLAAGETCQVAIEFSPQAVGDRTATLMIPHNAAGGSRTVLLSGIGVAIEPPQISAFFARPEVISSSDTSAELCYSITNATRASIRGIGDVPVGIDQCIAISPTQDSSYTLIAIGSDGQEASATTRIRVQQASPSTPQALSPGNTDQQSADNLSCRSGVILSWAAGSTGGMPTGYKVTLQRYDYIEQSWVTVVQDLNTTNTKIDVTQWVLDNPTYGWRWTVLAYDDNGNQSDTAPWHYLNCSEFG